LGKGRREGGKKRERREGMGGEGGRESRNPIIQNWQVYFVDFEKASSWTGGKAYSSK